MNKDITSFTSFRTIFRIPELRGLSNYYIGFKKGIIRFMMSFMNIETVYNRSKTRYTGDIVDSLNTIVNIKRSGYNMEYQIYSDDTIKRDKEKKVVTLMHFPIVEKKPFVLIIAGGAYQAVSSASEAFPTAIALNKMGYQAFTLNYRVGKHNPFPIQVEDLHQAIHYIFDHAAELNVDTSDYAVIGYSAGGHLTGTLLLDSYRLQDLPHPTCISPNYPALYYHDISDDITDSQGLTQSSKEDKGIDYIDKHLIETPPKVFWYHCKDDAVLPLSGSIKLDRLLNKRSVPHLFLDYPSGGHGCGLATKTSAEGWLEKFVEFWQS